MLTREEVFRIIVHDDEAMARVISLEGRAVFLLLCAESACLMSDLGDSEYRACHRFIWDAVCFLKTRQLSARLFENHVLTRAGDAGFLQNNDSDPANSDFWMFLTTIAGWFAVVAAQTQDDYSYFCDVEKPLSVNRVFYGWTRSKPQFLNWKYATDIFRFVAARFPANRGDSAGVDYGATKMALLAYLAQQPE